MRKLPWAKTSSGRSPAVAMPIAMPAHDRKSPSKVGHRRQELPDSLLRKDIILDVPESEKTCPCYLLVLWCVAIVAPITPAASQQKKS
jgi:hypothetical protein